MFFFKDRDIISKYKKYREVGKILNQKILDRFINREVYLKSGKYLGIVKRGTLVFNNELESVALMDFAINEFHVKGKNAAMLYREKAVMENHIEMEILDALIESSTSLYKVTDVNRQNKRINLYDVINDNVSSIEIIDIGLSQTVNPGSLFFTRIVPLADFNMTGGCGFSFFDDLGEFLLKESKRLARNVKSSNESIKKYVAFFKLYKRYGREMLFL